MKKQSARLPNRQVATNIDVYESIPTLIGSGAFFLIFGILFLIQYYNFMATAVPVVGIVTANYSVGDDYNGNVVYIVDGVEYRDSFLMGKKNVGDEIEIYVQPDDPSKIETKFSMPGAAYVFIAVGLFNVIVGFCLLISKKRKK